MEWFGEDTAIGPQVTDRLRVKLSLCAARVVPSLRDRLSTLKVFLLWPLVMLACILIAQWILHITDSLYGDPHIRFRLVALFMALVAALSELTIDKPEQRSWSRACDRALSMLAIFFLIDLALDMLLH